MTPLELLYFFGLSIKKRYCLRRQKRLPGRVISIGNLTLGGTGKTPAAIALAREALSRGFRPCVLTRGYKGTAEDPCFISRGEGPLMDAHHGGDEAVLMSEKLRGVPIIKGRHRYAAGMFALRELPPTLSPDLFILDDGFQHWRLKRDKDILLIDAANPFGNGRMLPLGLLREPLAAISRADVVVITKKNQAATKTPENTAQAPSERLVGEIRKYNGAATIFFSEHRPSSFLTVKADILPLAWAEGKRFFAFCGIGNDLSFQQTLTSVGVELAGFKPFGDHHKYSAGDLESITAGARINRAGWIVTTEKDIMRLKGFRLPENLVALAIEFHADQRFYEEVFRGMRD